MLTKKKPLVAGLVVMGLVGTSALAAGRHAPVYAHTSATLDLIDRGRVQAMDPSAEEEAIGLLARAAFEVARYAVRTGVVARAALSVADFISGRRAAAQSLDFAGVDASVFDN